MKINYEVYKDASLMPISEVAELLGMTPDKKGKYLCPCHDDHTPSMEITTSGKYANRFHCWSCGADGGPLDLAIAVKYNIASPSDSTPEQYREAMYGAARFIEKYFPGAIIDEENNKSFDSNALPEIPPAVLKYIGLKPTVLMQHNAGKDGIKLSDEEMAMMICDCLHAKNLNLEDYVDKLVHGNFPQISAESRRYIVRTAAEKQEELEQYENQYLLYLKRQTGVDYVPTKPEQNAGETEFVKRNMITIAQIHEVNRDFPLIPPNLVKQMGRRINIYHLYKNGVSARDIADNISKTLLDVAMNMKVYRIKLFKEFPQIKEDDKKYIQSVLQKNEKVLNRYYLDIDRYIDNERELELEKE